MNREQLQKDFFPTELMLKLYRDIPESEYETKIKLVNDYIEEVRHSYDEDVLKIKQQNQIAHIYWTSELYQQAINHFEIVVKSMEPEDYHSIYFLALNLLIRGNILLSNYKEAEKWAELAFENHHLADAISNLHILNDYCDVITKTETFLDKKHHPLIQSIIDEYGFPEILGDPVETIRSMQKRYKFWARKMGELELASVSTDLNYTILAYENYINSCEIEWFRKYALESIENIKNK